MEASDDEDDADSDKDFDYLMGKFQIIRVPSFRLSSFQGFKSFNFSTFNIHIFFFPGMPMWSLTQERKDELCKKRWKTVIYQNICFFVFDSNC